MTITKNTENILFRVGNGGFGKTIAATAVARAIKEQFPKCRLYVQSNYGECFKGLPFVDRFYPQVPAPYFRDLVAECEVLEAEPYIDLAFRKGREHLIDTWCRRIGVKPPAEKRGTIVLDDSEKAAAESALASYKIDRPLVAFQPFGGVSFHDPSKGLDPFLKFQARHLSVEQAQEIVDLLVKSGIIVLQISLPTEPRLKNCLTLGDQVIPPRVLFALLDRCTSIVAIDSFCVHAWAALGKKDGVFLWGYSSPHQYGYSGNNNMTLSGACDTPHCNRPETHLSDVDGSGQPWKCSHGNACMKFDLKTVTDAAIRFCFKGFPTMDSELKT